MAELAEQIKALRASVHGRGRAGAEWTRKAVRAERPVTARIRERRGEPQAIEAKPEPVVAERPNRNQMSLPLHYQATVQPIKPDFRHNVAQRRQG